MINWVTVKIFSTEFEAEFAKSVLEGHGISARILSRSLSGLNPALHIIQGVELQVKNEQKDEAIEVLAADSEDE